MASVLLVSKPVEPPWNDSSKNLVRDLAQNLQVHAPTVLVRRGGGSLPGVRSRPAYAAASGGFAPPLADRARVLVELLRDREHDLWHFFFAPNLATSAAGRVLTRSRRVPSVHTVCSAPRPDVDVRRVLFAQRNVVLSAHTERRLREASGARVVRIAPSVPPLSVASAAARAETRTQLGLRGDLLVVYPGDLEFGRGAELMVEVIAERRGWELALACRIKTPAAARAAEALRARAARLAPGRVVWIGETPRILDLLGTADVVALPSEDLYAKMDYPLAVLEAMALAVPVIVARGTPAAELENDGAIVVEPRVDAVARALERLESAAHREEVGLACRSRVLRAFDPRRMAAEYEALYDEVLRERAR